MKNSDLLECLVAWFAVSKDSPAMTGALGALWSRRNETGAAKSGVVSWPKL
jgi:hypothetical protein